MWGLNRIPADSQGVPLTPGLRMCEQLARADSLRPENIQSEALSKVWFLWSPASAHSRPRVAAFQGRRRAQGKIYQAELPRESRIFIHTGQAGKDSRNEGGFVEPVFTARGRPCPCHPAMVPLAVSTRDACPGPALPWVYRSTDGRRPPSPKKLRQPAVEEGEVTWPPGHAPWGKHGGLGVPASP